jgi:hypothetical protein
VAPFSIATLDVAPKFPMVIFSADAQIKFKKNQELSLSV